MASLIHALRNESVETMEKCLDKATDDERLGLVPIEIDGVTYMIPKMVDELINNLYNESHSVHRRSKKK
tara:strand:- start:1129 stop:1335 length:207 start_codon:yes stop_codon:yes gene_type:complete